MPSINIKTGVAHGELNTPLTAPIRKAPRLPLFLILDIIFDVGIMEVISLVSNAMKIIKMPRNMSQYLKYALKIRPIPPARMPRRVNVILMPRA